MTCIFLRCQRRRPAARYYGRSVIVAGYCLRMQL